MIKNKIHKCWRLGAGILLLNIAIFTVGCSSKSVDSKETTTNSETTVAQTTVLETTTVNYKKLINFKAEHPFYIKVNKKENFAIVYGIDKKGKYLVPYKAFVCSTGREDDFTPNGTFTVSEKYRWRLMVDNTYAQYAVRIQGQIMLHSVPYTSPESDALEYWEYNKLGNVASLGCVRFQVADIKWCQRAAIAPLPCLNLQLISHSSTLLEFESFKKCDCSRKTILQIFDLLRKCGLLAHTSPAFLKNCWIKKLFVACGSSFKTMILSIRS